MSTLYLRLPSRAVVDSAPQWHTLGCPFALVSNGNFSQAGAIEREGLAPLSELSATIAKAQRVVLLLAGSDVTVLRTQVPPLSATRLKAALPNLVEERLLCDPIDCVIVAGSLSGGSRNIAVVQRAWLARLTKTFIAFGANPIAAFPAQLCLAYVPNTVTASISEWGLDVDLTIRLSEQEGIGLTISGETKAPTAHEVIQALRTVVPATPITLYVPQTSLRAYQAALADNLTLEQHINVSADNWTHWITGAHGTQLNLVTGTGAGTASFDWHSWRWPLALAAAVLLINVSALNVDWWRMKSEADTLRSAMIQIYKSAYPKELVIIDPVAQMQQKIETAKRNSGLPAADDFTSITAAFGEAWASVIAAVGNASSIAALEYRERSLQVRLTDLSHPEVSGEGSGIEALTQQMKAALAKRNLTLALAPEQAGAAVWQIRSAK